MGSLFAAAIGVGRAEQTTIRRTQALAPQVKVWAGWVLVAVGVWFLILAVFAEFFARIFPV